MIWVQHDVYSNFTNSVNSGDTELAISIFKSELSDLIVYQIDSIFDLFDKLGIKYSKNESDEQILDKVLIEINTNDKLIKGLSFLIAQNNDAINKNKDKSWTSVLNSIKTAIKKINKEFTDNPQSKSLFKNETLNMIELKATKVGDRDRVIVKKDNKLIWILGIAIVGISAYLIYEYFKDKKEKELLAASTPPIMETGGTLDTSQNVASNTATLPTIPVVQPSVDTLNSQNINPINNNLDPAYNVSSDVLVPLTTPSQNPSTTVSVNVAAPISPVQNTVPVNVAQP